MSLPISPAAVAGAEGAALLTAAAHHGIAGRFSFCEKGVVSGRPVRVRPAGYPGVPERARMAGRFLVLALVAAAATSGAPVLCGGEEVPMIRIGSKWMLLLALVALLLVPAPATAAGPADTPPASLWDQARQWLVTLWSTMVCRGDYGLCIDPDGLTACGGDNGGCIDPNGLTACGGDHGACIDPNG